MILINTFLIECDTELYKTTKIVGHNGLPLVIDADINIYDHTNQLATIAFAPTGGEKGLKQGDVVIVHYHTVQPKYAVQFDGRTLYKCPHFQIWCVIKNETIIPLEDYIFIEPILEDKYHLTSASGLITKLYQENIVSTGIVFAIGEQADEQGVKLGDKVYLTRFADVSINILGKDLWRCRYRNIIGLERDGELICVKDKCIVKEFEGIIESVFTLNEEEKKERKGLVLHSNIDGVGQNDTVSFWNNSRTAFEYKNDKLAYLKIKNINYIQ